MWERTEAAAFTLIELSLTTTDQGIQTDQAIQTTHRTQTDKVTRVDNRLILQLGAQEAPASVRSFHDRRK